MKTIFIPAKLKSEVNKSKILEISKELPKNIAIAYSIQYQDQAKEIKDLLESKHKITKFIQVLGCSKPELSKNTQAILLIGDGRFHAISLSFETKLPVYILNRDKLEVISKKDMGILEKKQKASYLKFLNANKVGILISIKPGQQNLKKALNFKKNLNAHKSKISGATKSGTAPTHRTGEDFVGDKKAYLFITNNINTSEFENFGLDSWINTACPRLDMDDAKIININKIEQF